MNSNQPAAETTASVTERPYPSSRSAWFLVGMLMVLYVFSFMDRSLLGLLVGPIKETMNISDFQVSLLMGFSFALFYSILGLPIGRMADSRDRKWLIAAGLLVWTVMTRALRYRAQLLAVLCLPDGCRYRGGDTQPLRVLDDHR